MKNASQFNTNNRCTVCDHREHDHMEHRPGGCFRCVNYTCDPKAKHYGG